MADWDAALADFEAAEAELERTDATPSGGSSAGRAVSPIGMASAVGFDAGAFSGEVGDSLAALGVQ